MKNDTITPNRFDAGYDETYKVWLKSNIQSMSFPVPKSFHNLEDKEAKSVIELREVKWDTKEMHAKFLENQDTSEKTTRELERLRCSFDEFDV